MAYLEVIFWIHPKLLLRSCEKISILCILKMSLEIKRITIFPFLRFAAFYIFIVYVQDTANAKQFTAFPFLFYIRIFTLVFSLRFILLSFHEYYHFYASIKLTYLYLLSIRIYVHKKSRVLVWTLKGISVFVLCKSIFQCVYLFRVQPI